MCHTYIPFLLTYRGNDFLHPLVILKKSKIEGAEYAKKILETLERGENVIILSNHQTEADPQVISILLESAGLSQLAEQIIFIAGHKVTNDPVAIPFSMVITCFCSIFVSMYVCMYVCMYIYMYVW